MGRMGGGGDKMPLNTLTQKKYRWSQANPIILFHVKSKRIVKNGVKEGRKTEGFWRAVRSIMIFCD